MKYEVNDFFSIEKIDNMFCVIDNDDFIILSRHETRKQAEKQASIYLRLKVNRFY